MKMMGSSPWQFVQYYLQIVSFIHLLVDRSYYLNQINFSLQNCRAGDESLGWITMSLPNAFVFTMRDSNVHDGSAWKIKNISQCLEKPKFLSFVFGFLLCLVFGLIGFAVGFILRIKFYSSQTPFTLYIYFVIMGIELHKSRNYSITDLFDVIK